MNSTICEIQANPDVSGTGIRASIYALCLGGSIFSYLVKVLAADDDYEEFSRSVNSALSIQGLALLCTAIYNTIHTKLTLFHAICVVHLLALLGIDVVSKGRYKGFGPRRQIAILAITVIALCGFIAFNVYIWVTAPRFGSQPECNASTVYVVFGVSIKATAPVFRYIILGTFALIPASFIIVILITSSCFCCVWYCGSMKHAGSWKWHRWSESTTESGDDPKNHKQLTIRTAAYCGFYIYAIVSLEQVIQRNSVAQDEKEWTFGQVIALFILLGTANDLLNIFLANWDRRAAQNRGGTISNGQDLREGELPL